MTTTTTSVPAQPMPFHTIPLHPIPSTHTHTPSHPVPQRRLWWGKLDDVTDPGYVLRTYYPLGQLVRYIPGFDSDLPCPYPSGVLLSFYFLVLSAPLATPGQHHPALPSPLPLLLCARLLHSLHSPSLLSASLSPDLSREPASEEDHGLLLAISSVVFG